MQPSLTMIYKLYMKTLNNWKKWVINPINGYSQNELQLQSKDYNQMKLTVHEEDDTLYRTGYRSNTLERALNKIDDIEIAIAHKQLTELQVKIQNYEQQY